jgi:EF-P beta-lysylation protein EpmB
MIHRRPTTSEPDGWQRLLRDAITDPAELLATLDLPADLLVDLLDGAREAGELFPLRVPRGFVRRMRPGDPRDPLLLQVLGRVEETRAAAGFSDDPVAEGPASAVAPRPGVLHKYRGRVLFVVTGACAVHCRYCFRRAFPYDDNLATGASGSGWSGWDGPLDYVAGDASIREVILSGGDPLSASDERLEGLVRRIARIPHVERLRVHSRTPVVLPERVDEALVSWLAGTRLRPVLVIHANHAREIDGSVRAAMGRLREAGVDLYNQSVLLAGVNDSGDALVELSEALFDARVTPYYLHLLDRVSGAAHFEVDEARARRLVAEAAQRLPGYLVPRLVREVAGAPYKVPAGFDAP